MPSREEDWLRERGVVFEQEVTMDNKALVKNLEFWLKYVELGFPFDAQAKSSLTKDIALAAEVIADVERYHATVKDMMEGRVKVALDEMDRAVNPSKHEGATGAVQFHPGDCQDGARWRDRNDIPDAPGWKDGRWVGKLERDGVVSDGTARTGVPEVPDQGPTSPYKWTHKADEPYDSGKWTGREETTWDPGTPRRHPLDERQDQFGRTTHHGFVHEQVRESAKGPAEDPRAVWICPVTRKHCGVCIGEDNCKRRPVPANRPGRAVT